MPLGALWVATEHRNGDLPATSDRLRSLFVSLFVSFASCLFYPRFCKKGRKELRCEKYLRYVLKNPYVVTKKKNSNKSELKKVKFLSKKKTKCIFGYYLNNKFVNNFAQIKKLWQNQIWTDQTSYIKISIILNSFSPVFFFSFLLAAELNCNNQW